MHLQDFNTGIFGESDTFAFQISIKLALCHRLLPMTIQDTTSFT